MHGAWRTACLLLPSQFNEPNHQSYLLPRKEVDRVVGDKAALSMADHI